MKAMLTMTKNETKAVINGVNEIADLYAGVTPIETEELHNMENNAKTAKIHNFAGGWAQFRGERNEKNSDRITDYAIEMSAEEDATILMVKMMVKTLVYFAPVITPLMSMYKNLKALSKNWKEFAEGIRKEFKEKFHKPSTYATVAIYSEELDVAAAVIVEKDGYGNEPYITESVEITKPVHIDMLTRLWKQMEARKDTPTVKYPKAEYIFDNIEDARKDMEKMLDSIRADYYGMQQAEQSCENGNDNDEHYVVALVNLNEGGSIKDAAIFRVDNGEYTLVKRTHHIFCSDEYFSEHVIANLCEMMHPVDTLDDCEDMFTDVANALECDTMISTEEMGYRDFVVVTINC